MFVAKHIELSDNFKIRDEKAFKRITGRLLKLFFPNKEYSREELNKVADIALEFRQRVRD